MTGDVGRQKNNIGIKGCKNRVAEGCCHGAGHFWGRQGVPASPAALCLSHLWHSKEWAYALWNLEK